MTALVLTARDWRTRAACRDKDPELFFPLATPDTDAGERQVAEARAVCISCTVRVECLRFALATLPGDGIWAGTTADERKTARRHLTQGVA